MFNVLRTLRRNKCFLIGTFHRVQPNDMKPRRVVYVFIFMYKYDDLTWIVDHLV